MTGLDLKDISKRFGDTSVIQGVNLTVEPGEFCVFVGPSGCGKSTLLRMIAGLEETSSGTIDIGGRDMTRVDPADRGVAMVFQSYALYPHLTVAENMGYSLRIARKPKAEIRAAVDEVAEILELSALLDRKPRALSGGQRQRVAIGRAILRQPSLFLFDEPLSNLDAELRVSMRVEIAKLHRHLGATMIYVTHDQVEAMTLADRLVLLRAGRIEQQGRPLDLYNDPDNSFVAGFLGNPRMNFLPGKIIDRRPDGVVVELKDAEQPFDIPVAKTAASQAAQVEIGIRPDWFTLADDGEVELFVRAIENLGSEQVIHAQSLSGVAVTVVLHDSSETRIGSGHKIRVTFDAAKALLFNLNGDRLR
ncbi:ABC transporter ATP-binding protein [Tabrizicola sp. BL-A-41-H6]|uniref:ABC transporter ATP-binding protein n=1 Tax=Tabrizicola sp. BL-A-41-H6 TaxID=3421107 RepID=UPI003D667854